MKLLQFSTNKEVWKTWKL